MDEGGGLAQQQQAGPVGSVMLVNETMVPIIAPPAPPPSRGHNRGRSNVNSSIGARISRATERIRSAGRGCNSTYTGRTNSPRPALEILDDDELKIRHGSSLVTEYFAACSIRDGKLVVADMRGRIQLLLKLSDRQTKRAQVLYKGCQLKLDNEPVCWFGVKNNSEIMAVLPERSPHDSDSGGGGSRRRRPRQAAPGAASASTLPSRPRRRQRRQQSRKDGRPAGQQHQRRTRRSGAPRRRLEGGLAPSAGPTSFASASPHKPLMLPGGGRGRQSRHRCLSTASTDPSSSQHHRQRENRSIIERNSLRQRQRPRPRPSTADSPAPFPQSRKEAAGLELRHLFRRLEGHIASPSLYVRRRRLSTSSPSLPAGRRHPSVRRRSRQTTHRRTDPTTQN